MTFAIKLGKSAGKPVTMDVDRLLDSRALVCGNSGAGKSWLLRLIAEQVAPQVPTFVLDPEGEYVTLREAVDVVLVAADGDVRPTVGAAPLIARRLLELGTSAVIDLYSLPLGDRRLFVRGFLDALMDAPRSTWRPLLVMIDEAHRFAPERGDSEALGSVITLLSQGRKRGFGSILATQRLSKLHKDAAAELANVMVGRTTLDIDVARARDALGVGKDAAASLRHMRPGHWRAFGPAFEQGEVLEFESDRVRTTHPEAGNRHKVLPPKPSARIRGLLGELATLAERSKTEIVTLEQALARIAVLEQAKPAPSGIGQAEHDKAVADAYANGMASGEAVGREATLRETLAQLIARADASGPVPSPSPSPSRPPVPPRAPVAQTRRSPPSTPPKAGPPKGGLARMLSVLAQHPEGCGRDQLALLARLSQKGGTFGTYLSSARTRGWMDDSGGVLRITDKGQAHVGDVEPLPTGKALVEHWLRWCGGGGQRRLLEELLAAGERGLRPAELGERSSIAHKGGTFGTYLSKLRTAGLVEGRDPIRAVPTLLHAASGGRR